MAARDDRTLFRLMTRQLVEELRTQDFRGVLAYGADCIRRCEKLTHGEDSGETKVLRANMRTLAKRLERVAKSLGRR